MKLVVKDSKLGREKLTVKAPEFESVREKATLRYKIPTFLGNRLSISGVLSSLQVGMLAGAFNKLSVAAKLSPFQLGATAKSLISFSTSAQLSPFQVGMSFEVADAFTRVVNYAGVDVVNFEGKQIIIED